MTTDFEGDNIIQKVPLSVAFSDPRCKRHDPIRKKIILIDTLNTPCALFTHDLFGDSQVIVQKLQKSIIE